MAVMTRPPDGGVAITTASARPRKYRQTCRGQRDLLTDRQPVFTRYLEADDV